MRKIQWLTRWRKKGKGYLIRLALVLILPLVYGFTSPQLLTGFTDDEGLMINQNGFSQSAGVAANPLMPEIKLTSYQNWPAEMGGLIDFTTAVLDNNGKIWLIPGDSWGLVSFDISSEAMQYYPFNTNDPGMKGFDINASHKFNSVVFDGERYLWVVPLGADRLIKVDTHDGRMVGYSAWPAYAEEIMSEFFIGAAIKDEWLFLIPYNRRSVVIVDTTLGGMSAIGFPSEAVDKKSFSGGLLDDNDKLWMIPYDLSSIFSFDVNDHSLSEYPLPPELVDGPSNTGKFAGGIYDGQGYLWLAPESANQILRVKTSDASMTLFDLPPGLDSPPKTVTDKRFADAVFDGHYMWLVPTQGTNILRLDTSTTSLRVYDRWTSDLAWPVAKSFSGGIFDGNAVWLVPKAGQDNALVKISSTQRMTLTIEQTDSGKLYQPATSLIKMQASSSQYPEGENPGSFSNLTYFRVPLSDTGKYYEATAFTEKYGESAFEHKGDISGSLLDNRTATFELIVQENARYWFKLDFINYHGEPSSEIKALEVTNFYQPYQFYRHGQQLVSAEYFYEMDQVLTTNGEALYGLPFDLDRKTIIENPAYGYDCLALIAAAGPWQPHWILAATSQPEIADLVLDADFYASPLYQQGNYTFSYDKNYDYWAYSILYDTNGDNEDGPDDQVNLLVGIYQLEKETIPTHQPVAGQSVVFIGWSLTKLPILSFGEELPKIMEEVEIVDSSVNIYALWAYDTNNNGIADILEPGYNLVYDTNGGNDDGPLTLVNIIAQRYQLDDSLIPTHQKVGEQLVIFLGWSLNESAILYYQDEIPNLLDSVLVTNSDLMVYAVWAIDSNDNGIADVYEEGCDLLYDTNGGRQDGPDSLLGQLPNTYKLNSYTFPSHSKSNNCDVIFIGWSLSQYAILTASDEKAELASQVLLEQGTTTVYAVWGIDTNNNGIPDVLEEKYDLLYDNNGGQGGPFNRLGLLAGSYHIDGTLPTHLPIDDKQVIFLGWSLQTYPIQKLSDEIPELIEKVIIYDADVVMYAVWAYASQEPPITEYLVAIIDSYAEVCGSGTYLPGSIVQVNAGYQEGLIFDGWDSSTVVEFFDDQAVQTSFTMPAQNVIVSAKWLSAEDSLTDEPLVARPLNTGDKNNAVLIVGLVSSTAILILLIVGKKKREEKNSAAACLNNKN